MLVYTVLADRGSPRQDPLHQELLEAGCIFQERQGWERPGIGTKVRESLETLINLVCWLALHSWRPSEVMHADLCLAGWFSVSGANPVKTYDWYGAYGQEQHADHKYRDKLELDYTFAFPGHHENVRSTDLAQFRRVNEALILISRSVLSASPPASTRHSSTCRTSASSTLAAPTLRPRLTGSSQTGRTVLHLPCHKSEYTVI